MLLSGTTRTSRKARSAKSAGADLLIDPFVRIGANLIQEGDQRAHLADSCHRNPGALMVQNGNIAHGGLPRWACSFQLRPTQDVVRDLRKANS